VLRIQRSGDGEVVFKLSGRIDKENVAELQGVIGTEVTGKHLVLDLRDVILVGQDGITFLAECEGAGIAMANCPRYVREWITRHATTSRADFRGCCWPKKPGKQEKGSNFVYNNLGAPTDEEIIGLSPAFQQVLALVRMIAKSDSVTLIEGETGTGKEVIASAIHNQSSRRQGPFVKLNCAAIPGPLLESELFGHERGAYTGASTQTKGRFQMADRGTLFLDEIGDLPLELQPKLLRALQEQEFERLGSSQTIRVNVRVVAATNQDLSKLVANKQFRADLYYRLNVIPINLPPLRERVQDIPLLVEFFVRKLSARLNRSIDLIPGEVMEVLKAHDWPGNIRELQNFVERAVVFSPESVLRLPLTDLKLMTKQPSAATSRTLADAEREHILDVLKQTDGLIGGQYGAATRLGLPRTTLVYKMRKLGIEARPSHRSRFSQPTGDCLALERLGAVGNF
jgi:transcriptional regulator with GAF, ATPase, and Fis domain